MRSVKPNEVGSILFVAPPTVDGPAEGTSGLFEHFVGVEVPCLYRYRTCAHRQEEVRCKAAPLEDTFTTLQAHVIDTMAKKIPSVADFFREQGYPKSDQATFTFDASCAEVVRPVQNKAEFDAWFNRSCMD